MVFPAEGPLADGLERVVRDLNQRNVVGDGPWPSQLASPVVSLQFIQLEHAEIGQGQRQRQGQRREKKPQDFIRRNSKGQES